jgi:phospholipase C
MKLESVIHKFLKTIFWILNPFKKLIITTECQVHKHINMHALIILKNDQFLEPYYFYRDYLEEINKGAVWADQDFKSSNHFYNPYKKKEVCTAEAMLWSWRWITMARL